MCSVSLVMRDWSTPMSPNFVPWTVQSPDPGTATLMLEILKRLDALDKKLGAIDCKVEEQAKQEYIIKLRRRAEELPK